MFEIAAHDAFDSVFGEEVGQDLEVAYAHLAVGESAGFVEAKSVDMSHSFN